ncbi:MAG: DUF2934 domain-containing protein [Acidobacteria bacterium]|nr:DUF2934 domain-containing protein [Acidobacteriota bacterium]
MPKSKTSDTSQTSAPVRRRRVTAHKKAVAAAEPAAINSMPSDLANLRDEIERLAYSYWEQRGHGHGSDFDDWARAEREVIARQSR